MKLKTIARFVRSTMPVPLRKAIRKTGDFFGFGLDAPAPTLTYEQDSFPSIAGTLKTLHRLGFNPAFCVDVGAYHGEWTHLLKTVFPAAKVLMVEAQSAKRQLLEKIAAEYPQEVSLEMCLLGPADGTKVQFSEMETGSSVFPESSHYERKTTARETRRLDTVVRERNFPAIDFLKLDVQGYELEILKGAADSLRHTTAVLMEASFLPINAGCPLIGEVISHMSAAGFRLFDFCSQSRRHDGVLWQTDLLFLRENSPLVPAPRLTRENWG